MTIRSTKKISRRIHMDEVKGEQEKYVHTHPVAYFASSYSASWCETSIDIFVIAILSCVHNHDRKEMDWIISREQRQDESELRARTHASKTEPPCRESIFQFACHSRIQVHCDYTSCTTQRSPLEGKSSINPRIESRFFETLLIRIDDNKRRITVLERISTEM